MRYIRRGKFVLSVCFQIIDKGMRALSVMTTSTMALSIMTFSILTFSIT
jgi:hypothetical protein